MRIGIWQRWRDFHSTKMFSPVGFFRRALILLVLYFLCHVAGLREFTSIVSGSSPSGGRADAVAGALGAVYVVAYLIVVFIVPVLVIASGLFWAAQFWLTPREGSQPDEVVEAKTDKGAEPR